MNSLVFRFSANLTALRAAIRSGDMSAVAKAAASLNFTVERIA